MPQPTDRVGLKYHCLGWLLDTEHITPTSFFYNAVNDGEMVKPQFVSEISGIEP
jgi:hypothetical protein